jgi:hypothetical protein
MMRTPKSSVAIATALLTAACFTMRPVSLEDLGAHPASRVWVTRPDQSKVLVDGAQVFRGKLVGFVDGKYHELPPDDLHQMHVRKVAVGRTLSLVGAGIATAGVLMLLVSGGEEHFDPCAGDEDCSGELRVGPAVKQR